MVVMSVMSVAARPPWICSLCCRLIFGGSLADPEPSLTKFSSKGIYRFWPKDLNSDWMDGHVGDATGPQII